jgi:hypothetical protein
LGFPSEAPVAFREPVYRRQTMTKEMAEAIQNLVLMTTLCAEPDDEFVQLLVKPTWGKVRELWFHEAPHCYEQGDVQRIWDEDFAPLLAADFDNIHGD